MRLSRSESLPLTLRCVGLTAAELSCLFKDVKRELRDKAAFKNPSPIVFDTKAVHELLVWVPWAAIGTAAGKRAIEKS
ncbi:MAG: hypothetical protein JWN34_3682 [Bryobacterales bacterium]|nr:hypothetical protein [Bryobacterales bacterium]